MHEGKKQTKKQNNLQFVTCPIAILLFNFQFYLTFEQNQNSFLGFIYFFPFSEQK